MPILNWDSENPILAQIEAEATSQMASLEQPVLSQVETLAQVADGKFPSDRYVVSVYADFIILGAAIFSLLWGAYNVYAINQVTMTADKVKVQKLSEEEIQKMKDNGVEKLPPQTSEECFTLMEKIAKLIKDGAITFLVKEYTYLTVFSIAFSVLIYFTAEPEDQWFPLTTVAFLIGALTSMTCGYIGMRIAVHTNVRTTWSCCTSIDDGFRMAFKGGQVLGFSLVGLALLVLQLLIMAYRAILIPEEYKSERDVTRVVREMFECVAGYGLGGSTVALFGRVGGGIYTKAADVGADLAGKVCEGLEEDSPDNPGTIADNVGDNVGDIAGMGADLFGSLAEATCAALVVSAHSMDLLMTPDAVYFPLLVTSVGIFASFFSTFFATIGAVTNDNIESRLKQQLLISSVLLNIFLIPVVFILPIEANIEFAGVVYESGRWQLFYCVMAGLWSGLIIGYVTEYFTSNKYAPVLELVESCRMGAAPNIILGLALGYASTVVPILCLAVTIYISFSFAGMYGVALAAIGMLGSLPIALTIDGYGPIADNAGGISEMSYLNESVRQATDKLDAAGNTTAAIGKGFAIGSACLVGLALFGAYIARVEENSRKPDYSVNVLDPITFSGLIVGAMIPYAFSALTMSAVGQAANEMIKEIQRQFVEMKKGKEPDHERCVAISTEASLNKMIAPGALVLFTPLVVGMLFSKDALSGLLTGSIVSGIQIAFSFSNTGGAWDNAKKYVEEGIHESTQIMNAEEEAKPFVFKKKDENGETTELHKAVVVGDTVGDPLKDTSGPAINILIKLSAITSLIFGGFIAKHGGILIAASDK